MGVIKTIYDQVVSAIETAGFVVVDDLSDEVINRLPIDVPPVTVEIESIESDEDKTDALNSIIGLNLIFTVTIVHRKNEPNRFDNIENLISALLRVEINTNYRITLSATFTTNDRDMEVTEITVNVPTYVV